MPQDMVQRIRELYDSWIKDDATFLDTEEIFKDLLDYVEETKKDICGKCIPCRDGIPHIEKLLVKFEDGTAERKDLLKVEEYVANLRSAKCSVGVDFGKNMEVLLRNNFNDFHKKVRK